MQVTHKPLVIPGTIGAQVNTRVKTKTGIIAYFLERRARLNTKWRGELRPGGGYASDVTPPKFWRGVTGHTAGLNPFVIGNIVPRSGAPVGVHYDSGERIGCDPITWFQKKLIGNPSVGLMSTPAAGKSTAMRVMMTGLAAHGTINMVIGDIKDEHGAVIKNLGGKRVRLAPGRGCINVLDPGGFHEAMRLVEAKFPDPTDPTRVKLTRELLTDMHLRRSELVLALIEVQRGQPADEVEEALIGMGLEHMYEADPTHVPILEDLLAYLKEPHVDLKELCNWNGEYERYLNEVHRLLMTLSAICKSRSFGSMFNGHTEIVEEDGTVTSELDYSGGIAFDISGIKSAQTKLMAAAYLVTWIVTFGIIETSHALADEGVRERESFMAWMDEFWQPLAASSGIVDRVNRVGRTNRTVGVGTGVAMHTTDDLRNLKSDQDRAKAEGILNRCGMLWFGGLPHTEVEKVSDRITRLRDTETEQIVSWWNPALEETDDMLPGRGCFMIKRGELPGIPVRVLLTKTEIDKKLHETSARMLPPTTIKH